MGLLSEIVIDSFAGGGGASTGIEAALRAMAADNETVDVAINHNGAALAMHQANHPATMHLESDIWTVDPLSVTKGRPVGLLWGSPDCRHFSRAKGSMPVSQKIRGLAWSLAHWAEQVKPRIIVLENVEEFQTWGPVIMGPKGHEISNPARVGETFKEWVARFRRLGYRVEWKVLRACDYGAPTIRKRLYMIMRADGEAIVWPKPTHGDPKSASVMYGKRLPWLTAADVIEWSLPCPSILMTREEARAYTTATGRKIIRPLAANTLRRIAAGFKRYVLEPEKPFFITDRAAPIDEPLRTVTREPRSGLLAATLSPFMTAHYGCDIGSPATSPMRTITGIPKVEPVVSMLARPPLSPEQLASAQGVANFAREQGIWNGCGLVTIGDQVVVDIGMRMLTPRELARAQGFAEDYVLAAPYAGGVLSESDQRHKIGNSVCPPVAQALVAANYRPRIRSQGRATQGWLFEGAA